jgi:hypothetical protein
MWRRFSPARAILRIGTREDEQASLDRNPRLYPWGNRGTFNKAQPRLDARRRNRAIGVAIAPIRAQHRALAGMALGCEREEPGRRKPRRRSRNRA